MDSYELSEAADEDLEGIAADTIAYFGVAQARAYRDGLAACFDKLAQAPGMGVAVPALAPGLRRHVYKAHVIYYQPKDGGVLIVRVRHAKMDVSPELFDVLQYQKDR